MQNLLVLILIKIKYSENTFFIINAIIHNTITISNSITVAQFFNHVCKVFFDNLIQSDTEQINILEQIANHYNIIKTNNQKMFHFHILI